MKKNICVLALTAAFSVLSAATAFAGTWIQDPARPANQDGISNWWYRNDDGSYPANGWFWIDGNGDGFAESYRFDENGWMYAAATVDGYAVNESGAWTENGVVQYSRINAVQNTNTSTARTSSTSTKANTDSGTNTGSSKKNQWVSDSYGKQYYDSKGELVTGWKKISGKQYFFDDSGYALTGYQSDVEGNEYYFYKDGELAVNTVYDSGDGVYYVIDKEESYVVDIVDAEDWKVYKKEADKESVEVSKVSNEGSSAAVSADSSGADLSDEEAYEKLIALKKSYPEGMKWDNSNSYSRTGITGYGCAGFAFLAQDTVFGKSAPRSIYYDLSWDDLRVGDHLRMNYDTHSVIVLTVEDDYITVCEGNYNNSIHWGRKIYMDDLEDSFVYRETCYE